MRMLETPVKIIKIRRTHPRKRGCHGIYCLRSVTEISILVCLVITGAVQHVPGTSAEWNWTKEHDTYASMTSYGVRLFMCRLLSCHFFIDERLPRPISRESEGDLARDCSPYRSRMEVFEENVSFHDVPVVFMFCSNGCVPLVPFNGFWGVIVMYEHIFFFICFLFVRDVYLVS